MPPRKQAGTFIVERRVSPARDGPPTAFASVRSSTGPPTEPPTCRCSGADLPALRSGVGCPSTDAAGTGEGGRAFEEAAQAHEEGAHAPAEVARTAAASQPGAGPEPWLHAQGDLGGVPASDEHPAEQVRRRWRV